MGMKKMMIYHDIGVSEKSFSWLIKNIPPIFSPQIVNACDIQNGILATADIFLIGGGADLPYCERLNGRGNALIRHFVATGGVYVGICAGAYYGSSWVDFIGEGERICGARELAFFAGTARGCLPELTQNHLYAPEHEQSQAWLRLPEFPEELFYYHGGCTFEPVSRAENVLAHYPTGAPAVISGHFGAGNYLLSGVHFEARPHFALWAEIAALCG